MIQAHEGLTVDIVGAHAQEFVTGKRHPANSLPALD